MKETYKGYLLSSLCRRRGDDRYAIRVEISRDNGAGLKKEVFREGSRTACVLKEESDREAILLGKKIIDLRLIGF